MADEGKRGVGVRLFVAGGEVVRRTFDQIGDSGKKMWAEVAAGEKAANPALVATSRAAGEVRGRFDDLVGRAGPAANVLEAFGVAGIGAAAALGGLTIAMGHAREAMAFGDDLQATADKIGITAEALQEFRYVADEADVPVEKLEDGLQKLNAAIGAMQTGIGAAKVEKVFKALGLTEADLKGVRDARDLLPVIADRISEVGTTAEQVQIARKLGIEDLLPMLRMGADGIAELTDRSRELGLVLDNETVAALAEADRQMELSGQRIQTSMRVAFAGLADDIAAATYRLANFAVELRNVEPQANKTAEAVEKVVRWMGRGGVLQYLPGGQARGDRFETGVFGGDLRTSGAVTPAAMREFLRGARPSAPFEDAGGFGSATAEGWDGRQLVLAGGGARTGRGAREEAIRSRSAQRLSILTVDEQRAMLERIELEDRLAIARERGDAATVALLEREQELGRRIEEYRKAGLGEDEARISAGADLDRISFESKKVDAKPVGFSFVEGVDTELQETFREAFADGITAALNGDTDELLNRWLAEITANAFRTGLNSIADAFFNMVGGGQSDGGFWGQVATAATSVFRGGGGRASGGAMFEGYAYRAAEHDTELALIGRSGRVFSHQDTLDLLRGAAGGGQSSVNLQVVNATGVPARAEVSREPSGGMRLDLRPLGDRMVRGAGRSGELVRALRETPQPKRRG